MSNGSFIFFFSLHLTYPNSKSMNTGFYSQKIPLLDAIDISYKGYGLIKSTWKTEEERTK
jgi:hypothetical protein